MGCCEYLKKNLWQNVYVICLFMVIIIHFLFVELLNFIRDEDVDPEYVSSSEYVTMSSLLILEWFLIAFQCKVLYKYIFLTDVKPIFCLYLSKILAFADIYMLIFKISKYQFDHPNNILIPEKNYRDIGYVLLNYSMSIQTLTGISAVVPKKVVSEFFSAIQVICFGIGYSVFILSIAVLRFAQTDITSPKQRHPINDIFNNSIPSHSIPPNNNNDNNYNNNNDDEKQNSLLTFGSINGNENLKLNQLNTPRVKFIENYLKYAKFFYRYMMLILIGIQIPRLIIMYFVCDLNCENTAILIIGIIIDSVLLIITILSGIIRIRLIRTFGVHVNTSIIGIIRSYLTILIQFGILYFDVWIQTKNYSKSAFNVKTYGSDYKDFFAMFGHFLYFSTSTFTNVGAEATITTHESLGQLLNAVQMVMAVIFHTTVFGICLLDISSHRRIDTQKFVQSHSLTQSIDNIKETNTLRDVGLIQREIKQIVAAQNDNNHNLPQ